MPIPHLTTRSLAHLSLLASLVALVFSLARGWTLPHTSVRPTLATAPKTELARTLTNRNPAAARSYYVVKQPEDLTTYAHLVYGFPFPYLNDFTVEDVQEEGEFVLVQNPAVGMGFQLFITPDDQIGPHTAARIRHDLPNMPMAEVTEFMLTDGTHAVRFVSHDL